MKNVRIGIFLALLLAACGGQKDGDASVFEGYGQPLLYSLEKVPRDVNVSYSPVDFPFTVEKLESMAKECGTTHAPGYFAALMEKYKDAHAMRYEFSPSDGNRSDTPYIVTIIPNIPKYRDLNAVKKDFDQCWVAGDAYPFMLNDAWIVFENSCGSGVLPPGVKEPGTCVSVQENILLHFKP